MPYRPASPCPRCKRLGGCSCPAGRNHAGVPASRRGYGRAHIEARRAWAESVALGLVACRRCGQQIKPGERWDLGHSDDRTTEAPEHARCNRADGARRSHLPWNGFSASSFETAHFTASGSGFTSAPFEIDVVTPPAITGIEIQQA